MRRLFHLFVVIVTVTLVQFIAPEYTKGGLFDPRSYNEAAKHAKAGEWDDAIHKCVTCLGKEKPGHNKTIKLLKEVAPKAYEKHLKAAENYEKEDNWDSAVAEYKIIDHLVSLVLSVGEDFPTIDVKGKREKAANKAAEGYYNTGILLGNRQEYKEALSAFQIAESFVADYKDLQVQIHLTKEKLAEKHYNKGIELMKTEKPKEAAIEFRMCNEIIPYKDALEKYEEARQQALQKVCLLSFENRSKFTGVEDILTGKVIDIVLSENPEFMEIITGEGIALGGTSDAATVGEIARSFGVSFFIKGTIVSIAENSPGKKLVESKSETMYIYTDTGKIPLSYTVKVYEKQRSISMKLSYQIIDATKGTTKVSKFLSDTKMDVCKWGESDIDPSRLPTDYERLCMVERREPVSAEELVEKAVDYLSKRFTQEILDYFK